VRALRSTGRPFAHCRSISVPDRLKLPNPRESGDGDPLAFDGYRAMGWFLEQRFGSAAQSDRGGDWRTLWLRVGGKLPAISVK
jgi:hypothetical protein